jgi:hypothetical protein
MIRASRLRLELQTPRTSRFVLLAFVVVLVALNLIAFDRAIGWDVFHNSDSEVMLGVAQHAGWRDAVGWITGPWIGAPLCLYYRPTSSWLMWAEWALFGWNEAGYQWVGMALHLVAALCFWRIAVRLLGSELLGAIAALIFSLRPRNVRTLAVLTAQPDLVAAAFMFLSLLGLMVYLRCTSGRRGLWLAGSLAAALLSLGGKEMALSLPILASLIVIFVRGSTRREKAWLLVAYWATFALFMGWRTFAMSGLGYIPQGWRDPASAIVTFLRSGGLYFARPFAAAVMVKEWWPLVMFGIIGLYAVCAVRWRALRSERALLYGALPGLIVVAVGVAALVSGGWVSVLTTYPWELLGLMVVYVGGASLVIRHDRRAAAFVALWGVFAFIPAAYRVYDWSGKFFYIPQTFWAFGGALLVEALLATVREHRAP